MNFSSYYSILISSLVSRCPKKVTSRPENSCSKSCWDARNYLLVPTLWYVQAPVPTWHLKGSVLLAKTPFDTSHRCFAGRSMVTGQCHILYCPMYSTWSTPPFWSPEAGEPEPCICWRNGIPGTTIVFQPSTCYSSRTAPVRWVSYELGWTNEATLMSLQTIRMFTSMRLVPFCV